MAGSQARSCPGGDSIHICEHHAGDGQVMFQQASRAHFERLHSREYDREAILNAFDLLELDGTDMSPQTLDSARIGCATS